MHTHTHLYTLTKPFDHKYVKTFNSCPFKAVADERRKKKLKVKRYSNECHKKRIENEHSLWGSIFITAPNMSQANYFWCKNHILAIN